MGKPTGFLDYARQATPSRPPLERIRDWSEDHPHLPLLELAQQAGRCMDCGVPFCHTGTLISGMASGCPLNNLVPEWNDLVYRGQWEEAYIRLAKTNNTVILPANLSDVGSMIALATSVLRAGKEPEPVRNTVIPPPMSRPIPRAGPVMPPRP